MDISSMVLPKSSGIETIKKEFTEFVDAYKKAKNRLPDRLHLSEKYSKSIRKSLSAKKLNPERLFFMTIPVMEKGR